MKVKSRRLRFLYKLTQSDHYNDETTERHEARHTLSSTVVANPACSYAVGVIHQGRLILTPIRAVNQPLGDGSYGILWRHGLRYTVILHLY